MRGASGGSQENYRHCYSCGQSGHVKKDCKQPKFTEDNPKPPGARAVWVESKAVPQTTAANKDPYSFLESLSEEEAEDDAGVHQIRVKDHGKVCSSPHKVR